MDTRADLYGNILLAGGATMFPGFQDRLTSELKKQAGHAASAINLSFDPSSMGNAAWQGGAIMAGLDDFQDRWITRWSQE